MTSRSAASMAAAWRTVLFEISLNLISNVRRNIIPTLKNWKENRFFSIGENNAAFLAVINPYG